MEGKITECWLVYEKSIFFLNFASWRGQNYWPSNGPSSCLATTYYSEKLFSVTMAFRFEIVDQEYTEEFKDKSEIKMKTQRTARSDERTCSKSGRMKETCKQI